MFWTIYFIGVIIFTILMFFIIYDTEKTLNPKHDFKRIFTIILKDSFGCILFGLLWPCFVLQIIARILDIIVG